METALCNSGTNSSGSVSVSTASSDLQSFQGLHPFVLSSLVPQCSKFIKVVQREEPGAVLQSTEHFTGPPLVSPSWEVLKGNRYVAIAPRIGPFRATPNSWSRTKEAMKKRKYRSKQKNRSHEQAQARKRYSLRTHSVTREVAHSECKSIPHNPHDESPVVVNENVDIDGAIVSTKVSAVYHIDRWFHVWNDGSQGNLDTVGCVFAVKRDAPMGERLVMVKINDT